MRLPEKIYVVTHQTGENADLDYGVILADMNCPFDEIGGK
jgi:hypothetical protein